MPVAYLHDAFEVYKQQQRQQSRTRIQEKRLCPRCGQDLDGLLADAVAPYRPVQVPEMCVETFLDQVTMREGE